MLFRPRLDTVFRSRWKALWWSACILASVYFFIPKPQEGEAPAADAAAVPAAEMAPVQTGTAPSHNPWALDSTPQPQAEPQDTPPPQAATPQGPPPADAGPPIPRDPPR